MSFRRGRKSCAKHRRALVASRFVTSIFAFDAWTEILDLRAASAAARNKYHSVVKYEMYYLGRDIVGGTL